MIAAPEFVWDGEGMLTAYTSPCHGKAYIEVSSILDLGRSDPTKVLMCRKSRV